MLHFETIDPATLELLEQLLQLDILKNFRLAGGTSLALQMGHRKSIDLDFFGQTEADEYALADSIAGVGNVRLINKSKNIHIYTINNIKVDIVNYPFAWLAPPVVSDTLILAAPIDIAAMKLSAITGRGTKKDFIDLYFLLNEFSLPEMLDFHQRKFPDVSAFMVLKSLSYFADAENDPMPNMLQIVSWDEVKRRITNCLSDSME